MSGLNLRSADLSSTDLSSANLSSTDLSSVNLNSADMSSANLAFADLRNTDSLQAITEAQLREAANVSGVKVACISSHSPEPLLKDNMSPSAGVPLESTSLWSGPYNK